MIKIAVIGAGSLNFTRELVKDILSFPALKDSELALVDIHPKRLQMSRAAVDRIVREGGYPAKVSSTTDRKAALKGADAVLTTILSHNVRVWQSDITIPKKYGVDINIGDSYGPAGIFRALRTIPVMIDICRDVEKYCPQALLLNYTNPMVMLCRAMTAATSVKVVGLCHSVQGTAHMLAEWIGAPPEEVSYLAAGINHQAWFLKFRWKGRDATPLVRQAVARKEIYRKEIVRNEMFLALGHYVTESSGHNSEYNAWFRKRSDLIRKYCLHGTNWNPGEYAYILKEYLRREKTWEKEFREWLDNPAPLDLKRGGEYAASILNAVFGDHDLFEFNGNIPNDGLIDNLPPEACVEVPVVASKRGLDPLRVGTLPTQLAVLNNIHSACSELAVGGSLEGNPEKIYHSICHDPLTSAVLSLSEIRKMVNEMFAANKPYLPQFKKHRV